MNTPDRDRSPRTWLRMLDSFIDEFEREGITQVDLAALREAVNYQKQKLGVT